MTPDHASPKSPYARSPRRRQGATAASKPGGHGGAAPRRIPARPRDRVAVERRPAVSPTATRRSRPRIPKLRTDGAPNAIRSARVSTAARAYHGLRPAVPPWHSVQHQAPPTRSRQRCRPRPPRGARYPPADDSPRPLSLRASPAPTRGGSSLPEASAAWPHWAAWPHLTPSVPAGTIFNHRRAPLAGFAVPCSAPATTPNGSARNVHIPVNNRDRYPASRAVATGSYKGALHRAPTTAQ